MSTLWTILGALGLVLAAGLGVWYKARQAAGAQNDAVIAEQAKKDAETARQLAEKQLQEKAKLEKDQLEEKIARIKAMQDGDDDKKRAAILELLRKLRGVT